MSTRQDSCPICESSSNLREIVDFGSQPNGNHLLSSISEPYKTSNLKFIQCTNCFLIIQQNTFTSNDLYDDHPYLTQHNIQYLLELENFADICIEKSNIKEGMQILDIGCNDGSLLKIFKDKGISGIGVDPSKTSFKQSQSRGINVLQDFWSMNFAKKHKVLGLTPDLITSTASFYHMSDLHDWFAGIDKVLPKNGYFFTQFVYSVTVIQNTSIDQFYHEHTYLHCLTSVYHLANKFNFQIIHLQNSESQGGSLIIGLKRRESYYLDPSIASIIESEKQFFSSNAISKLSDNLKNLKLDWKKFAQILLNKNIKLIGIGASLRGISLINFLEINPNVFEYLVEVNQAKVSKFTPKSLIPIVNESTESLKVNYYIILAWTQKDFILNKFKDLIDRGSTFILPFPRIEVIGKDPLKLKRELGA